VKKANKIEEKKRNPSKRSFLLFALLVLVIVSGLALTQTVLATHGPGPTYADQSCTICPDNDKDGYRAYCDTSHVFDKEFSCSNWPPPDCNDTDSWSHSYGSKDIASVKVEYAPAYVAKTQTDKKFTPDSKKLNPTLGDLLVTVTFKAKKCGATTPAFVPMKVYYTTKDSSGNEVSFYLIFSTPDNRTLGSIAKVSDLVYKGLISTSQDPRFLPTVEPYIASVAAGRPVQLKFLGPDIGPNKDTPKYQPLPMTNCAQVYGSGEHRVLYVRGQSSGLTATILVQDVQSVYSTGFSSIQPFSSNQEKFSHFIDLKNHYDTSWRDRLSTLYLKDTVSSFPDVNSVSSCRFPTSLTGAFIAMPTFKAGDSRTPSLVKPDGVASLFRHRFFMNPVSVINKYPLSVSDSPTLGVRVFIHEGAHAFANLYDEYFQAKSAPAGYFRFYSNCAIDPGASYRFGWKVYGRTNIQRCSALLENGKPVYRPSVNSLMNELFDNRFNVVSCGYLLKSIKNGGSAHSYFPECAAMQGVIPVGE